MAKSQGNITNTETTTIDETNISVGDVEENATVLGNISGGDDVEINITSTDQGAVTGALDFARDVNDNARTVFGAAIDANENTTRRALAFGQEALEFGRDALSDTLDFADRESSRYLKFASGAFDRASDTQDKALSSVRAEAAASRSAIIDAADANRSALLRTFDGSFEAIRSGFGDALGALAGSVDKVTRAVTGTIETATNATRSETAQGFDTLIKYGAAAAAAIAVSIVIWR